MKRIYSFAGGKGGTGKTFIAASLGTLLALRGSKVLLIDLDLGGSNLHTYLAVSNPRKGLNEYVTKQIKDLNEAVVSTQIPNLFFISSANCSLQIANLYHLQKVKIIKAIKNLAYDYILLDLGAGTHFNILDFCLIATEGIFITTPEPTSIENTFRFIKAIYLRNLTQILKESGIWYVCQREIEKFSTGAIKYPYDLICYLARHDSANAKMFQKLLDSLEFKLIINMYRQQVSKNLGMQITTVLNRHFYHNFDFLGNVNYDERVNSALFDGSIFVHTYPHTKTTVNLRNLLGYLTKKTDYKFAYSW